MKLLGVEAGRGIAALLVVCLHAADSTAFLGHAPFAGMFRFAHAGVDFFFVLSGFIIYYVNVQDMDHPAKVWGYYWKRFVRIYPTYWIITAALGLLLVVSPTKDRYEQDIGNVISSILLLPTVHWPILPQAWTLRHELLFYFLFSILFIDRRIGWTLMGIWGVATACNAGYFWITGDQYFSYYYSFVGSILLRGFNLEFFFGMFVAWLVLRAQPWRPYLLLVIGIAIFFGNGLYESWGPVLPVEWPPRHLAYAIGSALALYGLVGAEKLGKLKVPAPLVLLGGASYSLYLVHDILILLLHEALRLMQPYVTMQVELTFILVVGICVASAIVFHLKIEQPMLRLLRRGIASRVAPGVNAPAIEEAGMLTPPR
jgi:exopolysaccharide production protein ExoZ